MGGTLAGRADARILCYQLAAEACSTAGIQWISAGCAHRITRLQRPQRRMVTRFAASDAAARSASTMHAADLGDRDGTVGEPADEDPTVPAEEPAHLDDPRLQDRGSSACLRQQ